jgi:hypothetical protein
MGANAREFLEIRMAQEDYQQVPEEIRGLMEVRLVKVEGEDYSHDELWRTLNDKSKKAYKALKDREYDLRHNFKK